MSLRFWRRNLPAEFTRVPRFGAEDVVRASFQAILGREPDDAGLASHSSVLARNPREMAKVMRSILTAPESLAVNRPLLLEGLGAIESPVVSLGTHCFASEFLKRQGLRQWAGPFDWIFSTIPMVEHCIRDDFATFLDRTQYRPIPLERRSHGTDTNRVDHAFYRARYKVQSVFNHHDVHEDKDYGYLVRCVERFRAALRSRERHVFLLMCHPRPQALEELRALDEAIRQASGGSRHRLLAFVVDARPSTRLVPELRVEHDDATLTAMNFQSVSSWDALTFADPIDELVISKLLRDVARRQASARPSEAA